MPIARSMTGNSNGLTGLEQGISIQTATVGGQPIKDPILITSTPNSITATQGNNAKPRVIIDGINTAAATGFVIDASNSFLRGLIIDEFGIEDLQSHAPPTWATRSRVISSASTSCTR